MEQATLLIVFGLLFLAGLVADQLGRYTRLPRITMLLMLGLLIGKAGFDLLPEEISDWFDPISIVALTMVAFLLGGTLTRDNLARHGRTILSISFAIVAVTLLVISLGLILVGVAPALAMILGAIATATAPAAMNDVIHQSGIENSFTDTLKGIVAIDDVWGLAVFTLIIVFVGQSENWANMLIGAGRDLGGGIVLGILIGGVSAKLTGRLKPGEPLQAEAIGIVFLTAGLSLWFEVSFLIAGMTAGVIVANFARHHDYAFHEIENIQWPFMILFFVLAGASLEFEALRALGLVGVLYILLRVVARIIGGAMGAYIARVPASEANWYGPALLPQAGVAVGMALVAGEQFPQLASEIMALTISATVIFEILGPPMTLLAIRKVHDVESNIEN